MHIESIRTLDGPNVFHALPVLSMYLRLEDLADTYTDEVPGFTGRLVALLPGLRTHHCSRGYPGGFVERLHEGTYFGHVTEHVALEMAGMLGSPVTYGKTRYAGEPGFYQVIVRYRSEARMRSLLRSAVELVEAVVAGRPFPVEEHLALAARAAIDNELGPSTKSIVTAAVQRGIPWRRLNDANLVQLGYGRNRRLIQAAVTDRTSHVAVDIAADKALTKRLLSDAGVPVPRGAVVDSLEAAMTAFADLGAPVVVKPLDGNQGRGITLGVSSEAEMEVAYRRAYAVADQVIVEQQLVGNDYRMLMVGGRLVAASHREPCHVIGDGSSTVTELIEKANRDPLRGEGHEKPLTKIVVDEELELQLARAGMGLDSVAPAGVNVVLRGCANLSTGATAADVTERVSPEVREVCERAAAVVGLDICGIDLVAPDIGGAFDGAVVEINAGPGLRMHVYPSRGTPQDVGGAIVDMLYPAGAPSRVPICSVTGTNGKTTVTRMIGHILSVDGASIGMTTTEGIFIGGKRISRGDHTGAASARAVLADPSVDIAVLETARGGILRRGLGYDLSDVAVITNVTRDHIGQDGIETVDDLVWIKSLIAERVRNGGTLVLNAEDHGSSSIAKREAVGVERLQLVYFALDGLHPTIRSHLAAGGRAYFVRDGWLVEAERGVEGRIVAVADVPATFGGKAAFQVANCLAAAAAARALGCTTRQVALRLASFSDTVDNPGRSSLYQLGNGYVMVDYGHNPAAFKSTGALVEHWSGPLIGIVGAPGDREDAIIHEVAAAAAEVYPHLLIREDADRRGRAPGEVPAMMRDTITRLNPAARVEIVVDELEALRTLLPRVVEGTLVVIYYEHLDPVAAILTAAGGRPADGSRLFAGPPLPAGAMAPVPVGAK